MFVNQQEAAANTLVAATNAQNCEIINNYNSKFLYISCAAVIHFDPHSFLIKGWCNKSINKVF